MFFWNSLASSMIQQMLATWSVSSAFSKSSLNIWRIMVHTILKPGLENFEHYFANILDECKCAVVWTFFWNCLSLGLEWKLTHSSSVPTAAFSNLWHIECNTFTASSFRSWNSWTGFPSPPWALFAEMLPKAHLTSHSRMSGSRWVITPSWLSGSWRSFFV